MSKILATPRNDQRTDNEIRQPYKCFCCADSGKVCHPLITEFVDFPESGDSLPYICKRYDCEIGEKFTKCWEASDAERNAYKEAKARGSKGDGGDGIPQPMRQRDWQANFSMNLNSTACDWLHEQGLLQWRESLRSPKVNVFQKYTEAASDRTDTINSIRAEMKVRNLTESAFEAALVHCIKRDGVLYLHWESLPTATLKVLLGKMQVN